MNLKFYPEQFKKTDNGTIYEIKEQLEMKHEIPCRIEELGTTDYIEAFEMQKKTVDSILSGSIQDDIIFILEHPPVFTLGKRGGEENLTVSREFLSRKGIEIIKTERGGNITYHGPGQLVMYPIVNLERRKTGVAEFVNILEEVMIRTASDFGVTAVREEINHGVWVKDRSTGRSSKLGSIGLSVKKNISFHGLALNVNLDLTPFTWINPCGLTGVSMTSIERELHTSVDIKNVKERLLYHFRKITGNQI